MFSSERSFKFLRVSKASTLKISFSERSKRVRLGHFLSNYAILKTLHLETLSSSRLGMLGKNSRYYKSTTPSFICSESKFLQEPKKSSIFGYSLHLVRFRLSNSGVA